MGTAYNSSNSNRLIKASTDKVRVMSEVVDFSSTTNVATDTFDVIGIPANSLVLAAGMDVLTVDDAGNSGTVSVGDSASATYYTAAIDVTNAGQAAITDDSKVYSAGDDIRLTVATGAVNCKVRVWATVISLDQGGNAADTEAQAVTFS